LELLGEAELGCGERAKVIRRGQDLAALGASLGCNLAVARGHRLWGSAEADGDLLSARAHLGTALSAFVRLEMPFEAARTRRILAELLAEPEPALAKAEAATALGVFERLGAGAEADATAALLRRLGVKAARVGPKGVGGLTKREREVLQLLGEGLSNPEIGSRLHVSRKTVEHHVAHVLSKLGARSRAEAAVVAVRGPDVGSTTA
jgi:DNA-binding CsgD family transcriptional regulator